MLTFRRAQVHWIYFSYRSHLCNICNISVVGNRKALRNHQRIHMPKRHICAMCERHFIYQYQLQNHMLSHSTNKPYVCELCNTTFKYKHSFNAHVATVHNGVMSMVECNVCGKGCTGRAALKRHKLKMHANATYKCDKCFKTFLTKRNFNEHTETPCNAAVCKICQRLFASARALKRHLITIHTDIKCETCRQNFSCLDELSVHRDTSVCRKKHTCPKCGKVFYNLNGHMQKHAEEGS